MSVLICADLYPTQDERTPDSHTFAIRHLVEGARDLDADIRGVVSLKPLATRTGISWPRVSRAGVVPVIDLPRIGVKSMVSGVLTRGLLRCLCGVGDPDVVVCHLAGNFLPACLVFDRARTSLVFVVHASDLLDPRLGECLRLASAVYCRSDALRRRLALEHGFKADGVVASGVAASDFGTPDKAVSDDVLRIVMATRLIPLRNVGPVLHALAMLPPKLGFEVEILGDGPLLDELQRLVVELGLQDCVALRGFRPRQEVLHAMRGAHLFVMPSAPETFGLAYLEAMAQGCVVIGHAGWGIDGVVVDGGNGFLVPSATPEHIAERILAYMASDRRSMHQRAYDTARRHTSENAAADYAAMIGSARARRRAASAPATSDGME